MFCNNFSTNIWHGIAHITTNSQIAEKTYRLQIRVEKKLPAIYPGAFVMLRLPNQSDPLLGRPLAVYQATQTEKETVLDIIYLQVGKMTSRLARLGANAEIELWGPLGKGFKPEHHDTNHLIMVAGGIGYTPFLMLAAEKMAQNNETTQQTHCTLLYGTSHAKRIPPLDDFERMNVEIHLSTDDGSAGHHGFVTDLIQDQYERDAHEKPPIILACGPKPMLKAAFRNAEILGLPCFVSLETPMSCGLGICFGCVVPVLIDDGIWDYQRTCVDGPVFDAYRLKWE
ncbi:MAG: dihydroorotate dehydrogenase electron transfer subunit [Thermoguttaceae bacterium]